MGTHGRIQPQLASVTRLLSIISILLIGLPSTAEGANALNLEIRKTPDGAPVKSFEIDLGTADTGKTVFWLTRDDATPLEGVELQASIQGTTVQLSVSGAGSDGVFAVPPVRRVDVTVSGVAEPGTLEGQVFAVRGDQVVTLGPLVVKRQGVLSIEGVGVGDAEIAGSTESETFVRSYTITSTDPAKRQANLVLSQFVGPDGAAAATTIKLAGADTQVVGSVALPVDVKAGSPVSFMVTVDLAGVGDYSSHVALIAGGRREFVRVFRATRSGDGSASLTINPLSNKRLGNLYLWGSTSANLNVTVTENNREEVTIDDIELFDLDLVEGESRVDADHGNVAVTQAGSAVTSLRVPRNQTEALVVQIDGLSSPGQYSGTLRMTSGYSTPVDQTFTIFVRRHWAVALLFISLGVGLGAFLRWLGVRRKQYAAQDRLGQVLHRVEVIRTQNQDLEGPLEELRPRLEVVLAVIERRVNQVNAMIVRNPQDDWEAVLSELELKVEGRFLPEWVMLARRAYETRQVPQVNEDLIAVAQFLGRWGEEDGKANALAKLDIVKVKLTILEVRDAVAISRPELGDATVADVLQQLQHAEAAVATNPEGARNAYDGAWRNWIGKYIERVLNPLPSASSYPLGFKNQKQWADVRDAVEAKLNKARTEAVSPKAAIEQYRAATAKLLDELLKAFVVALKGVRNALEQQPGDEAAKKTYLTALDQVDKQVNLSCAQLERGDAEGARVAYEQAITKFKQARGAYNEATTGQTMSASDVVPAQGPPTGAAGPVLSTAVVGGEETGRRFDIPKASWRHLKCKRVFSGILWTVLAIAVVGVLGLLVLWVNSPDWGSLEDIVVAFLWGIGLYTGTAVTTGAAANRFTQIPGAST